MSKKDKKDKSEKNIEDIIKDLEKEKKQLEEDLKKLKEVTAHTQAQYVDLKRDFDLYIQRIEKQQKEIKDNTFVEVIKQLIPIIEQLRLSVENIPEDLKNNSWAKWVVMVYDNIKKFLESKWVVIEDSVWKEIDLEKHEPIGYEEVDEDMKNKVVKEHSKLYLYKKGDNIVIISPAKVVVGK